MHTRREANMATHLLAKAMLQTHTEKIRMEEYFTFLHDIVVFINIRFKVVNDRIKIPLKKKKKESTIGLLEHLVRCSLRCTKK